MTTWRVSLQQRARALQREVHALYLAYRDPRTPWYARGWSVLVLAYAASPIDLIPDFIPVLGYLDDLLIVPLGIWVALRLIPAEVMRDCRARAQAADEAGTLSTLGIVLVVIGWLAGAALVGWLVWLIVKR